MTDVYRDDHPEESDLDMLLRLVDETEAAMRKAAREKLETKRSVQRTLDEEEARRSLDATRLGSHAGAAAFQREIDRKDAERRDAEKRRREDRAAFKEIYGIDLDA